MKTIAPKRLMESVFPTVRNGSIFNASSLDLQFARTKTLDPRIDFTRASSGTYVGSDGLIKTATTNLLLRSEEFDTTWAATGATIGANAETAPNGLLTADKIVADNGTTVSNSSVSAFVRQDITKAASATTYTFSIYAKAGEFNGIRIFARDGATSSNNAVASANLSDGTVLNAASAGGTFSNASLAIANAGNGWYKAALTFTTSTETSLRLIYAVNDSSSTTGNASKGIFVWGAQLEQSSTVGEYVKTTSTINSAPRFDHNPTTGESLGLLVEESRTNSWLQSENFGTSWLVARTSVSTNAIAAPDGNSTADKLVEDTTANNSHYIYQSVSVTSGTTYTASAFVKAGERTSVLLQFFPTNSAFASSKATFNLSTGAITDSSTVNAATITPYPNGWYRITATETATATATGNVGFILVSGTTTESYTGDGTSGLYIWGAQLEAGSFPTSYIPTTTAAVTRSADVASITGTNFSSWYRQDEGTVYSEPIFSNTVSFNTVYTLGDGTSSNRTRTIQWNNGTNRPLVVDVGGAAQVGITGTGGVGAFKFAVALKANDFAVSQNGATASTDISGLMSIADKLFIGNTDGSVFFLNGTLKRLTYWPSRLSNSTLQTITQ